MSDRAAGQIVGKIVVRGDAGGVADPDARQGITRGGLEHRHVRHAPPVKPVTVAPIVMNELRRLIAPHLPAAAVNVPDGIALTIEPIANCHRYDYLLGTANVH